MATFLEKNIGPLLKEVTLLDSSMNFICKKKTLFVKTSRVRPKSVPKNAHSAEKTKGRTLPSTFGSIKKLRGLVPEIDKPLQNHGTRIIEYAMTALIIRALFRSICFGYFRHFLPKLLSIKLQLLNERKNLEGCLYSSFDITSKQGY